MNEMKHLKQFESRAGISNFDIDQIKHTQNTVFMTRIRNRAKTYNKNM